MSLSVRLRDLRIKSGQSLQDVADAMGVSKTHVWELEKGRSDNPSLEFLKKLSVHFNVTIQFLVGEDVQSGRDSDVQRLFRQVGELSDRDRRIVDDMVQSLHRQKDINDPT
jgi:transcriptional regulator with XRE-family HTH domain